MLEGPLRKMRTQINDPIDYYMTFPSVFVRVNDLIGNHFPLPIQDFLV